MCLNNSKQSGAPCFPRVQFAHQETNRQRTPTTNTSMSYEAQAPKGGNRCVDLKLPVHHHKAIEQARNTYTPNDPSEKSFTRFQDTRPPSPDHGVGFSSHTRPTLSFLPPPPQLSATGLSLSSSSWGSVRYTRTGSRPSSCVSYPEIRPELFRCGQSNVDEIAGAREAAVTRGAGECFNPPCTHRGYASFEKPRTDSSACGEGLSASCLERSCVPRRYVSGARALLQLSPT